MEVSIILLCFAVITLIIRVSVLEYKVKRMEDEYDN